MSAVSLAFAWNYVYSHYNMAALFAIIENPGQKLSSYCPEFMGVTMGCNTTFRGCVAHLKNDGLIYETRGLYSRKFFPTERGLRLAKAFLDASAVMCGEEAKEFYAGCFDGIGE